MLHLDLFSGIGGFAYAADQVFGDVEHIFCDNDKFCQQVLKKHWPESEVFSDIRNITNTNFERPLEGRPEIEPAERYETQSRFTKRVDLLTGGFPCQPFSAAGLRRGTSDERHLWPEMLRVIRLTSPTWVIAENVRGLITWNDGLVFEQVCADLEASGYEVQPFIIPAVAVNAPHRRDRIWFVAHHVSAGSGDNGQSDNQRWKTSAIGTASLQSRNGYTSSDNFEQGDSHASDYSSPRLERRSQQRQGQYRQHDRIQQLQRDGWSKDWHEVAAEFCRVDDGLPVTLDGFELSKSQHRKEQLKAYGNAIVPQVAMQIMEAIKSGSKL